MQTVRSSRLCNFFAVICWLHPSHPYAVFYLLCKKQDEKKRTHFYQKYANILERLQEALEADISLYRDLYDLMRKLVEYMLKKQVKLKEGVEHVMGGKVLPLPSDVLREAENKGKIAGKIEGKIEGENIKLVSLTRKKLIKNMDVNSIADLLEEDVQTIQRIVDFIESDPNLSDEDIAEKVFLVFRDDD